MKIIIRLGKIFFQFLYYIYRIFPSDGRILIVSRQSDTPSVDIKLLNETLLKKAPEKKVCVLCRYSKSEAGIDIGYIFYMMGTLMPNFAKASVVVLDGYCIPASILKHRKTLRIIQMWHAMGSFKRFGLSILGEEEGHSKSLAALMNMHEGYEAVLVSSSFSAQFMKEAFGYGIERMKVMPLPRVDFIRRSEYVDETRKKVLLEYPELSDGRKVILYAPTFRRNEKGDADNETFILNMIKAIDTSRYHLVIRPHPIVRLSCDIEGATVVYDIESIELLCVCDCVITDYSAFVLEAALANKEIYRYIPDHDSYLDKRGFYVDIDKEWPGFASENANEVASAIEKSECNLEEVRAFADKYVSDSGHCTSDIADYILGQ